MIIEGQYGTLQSNLVSSPPLIQPEIFGERQGEVTKTSPKYLGEIHS
jgi:hypothetical protein